MISRRFAIDITPLRTSPAFRNLYAARAISVFVYGVMSVSVNLQMFELTGSSSHVALLSLTIAAPMMICLLLGGVFADRYDRRRLILWSRTVHLSAVTVFLVNASGAEPAVWPLYLGGLIGGATGGISMPALMAATPTLVGRDKLAAAGVLDAAAVQTGAILGPALAGLLVSGSGFVTCYAVVVAGAAMAPLMLMRLPTLPPSGGEASQSERTALVGSLQDGLSYAIKTPVIAGVFLVDIAATLFATPFAMLPRFGSETLGGNATTVGFLFSAPAIGALAAALSSGWTGGVTRPGAIIIFAVFGWGLAVIGLGAAPCFPVAMICLTCMGFADTISEVLRRALVQGCTPDHLLGRVSSIWMIQAITSPALGNIIVTATAESLSSRVALVLGGVACLAATSGIALLFPALLRTRVIGGSQVGAS